MANFANLKAAINAVIKQNGHGEITGEVMNQVLTAMVNSLGSNYQFAGVATPSTNPGTPDQNVFYMATQAGTYTNFSAIVLQAGISILLWNGSWLSETFFTIDSVPTSGSNNFITSGAVFDKFKLDGGAYDVSAHNNNATFADLSAILNSENLNTLIPVAVRHGGMSIKFVQSSDNKYIQARCMAQNFTTDITQWQGVDVSPTDGSKNLVESGGTSNAIEENTAIIYNRIGGDEYVDLSKYVTKNMLVTTSWTNNSNYSLKFVPVSRFAGGNMTIQAPQSTGTEFAFLKALPNVGDSLSSTLCVGQSGVIPLTANISKTYNVPNDCLYLYIYTRSGAVDKTPQSIHLEKTGTEELTLKQDMGILADVSPNGNGSNWVEYKAPIIIKAGEKFTVKLKGPITFAGTSSDQTFIYVHLKKVEDGSELRTMLIIKGNQQTSFDSWEGTYTPQYDCYLWVEGRYLISERLSIFAYKGFCQQIDTNKEDIAHNAEENEKEHSAIISYRTRFIGKGSDYAESPLIYNCIPGHTYKVLLPKTTWDRTGVPASGVNIFSINALYNSVETALISVNVTDTVKHEYIFKIPQNIDYLRIGGRAAANISVYFEIEDITSFFIAGISNKEITVSDVIKGSIYNGAVTYSTNAILTTDFISTPAIPTLSLVYGIRSDGYHWEVRVVQYNNNKQRISTEGQENFTANNNIKLLNETRFIKCVFRLTDSSSSGVAFDDIQTELNNGSISLSVSGSDYASEIATARVFEIIDKYIDNPTGQYQGEKISLSNPYKIVRLDNTITRYCQSFAIYGDYMACVDNNNNIVSVYLYNIPSRKLLATLELQWGNVHIPHCNVACFSRTFKDGNTQLPLLYISQWDYEYERGCLAYNIQYSNDSWSAELIQTIIPESVSNSILGNGDVDWVVDYDNNYLYALGYYLAGPSTIVDGNKEMIVKFKLPSISDGSVVSLSDDDIVEHYEVEMFNYSQDKCYHNGRIYIISGGGITYTDMNKLRVLDLQTRNVVSIINAGSNFTEEPEALDVYRDKLYFGMGNAIYQLLT